MNTTNLNKKIVKVRKIYYLKLFNFFIKEAKDVRFIKMLINNSETQLINRYYFEFFLTKLIV